MNILVEVDQEKFILGDGDVSDIQYSSIKSVENFIIMVFDGEKNDL